MDGYDNNSGRKTGRRSYTFPSKGSRSNVSTRDKLIKKKKCLINIIMDLNFGIMKVTTTLISGKQIS